MMHIYIYLSAAKLNARIIKITKIMLKNSNYAFLFFIVYQILCVRTFLYNNNFQKKNLYKNVLVNSKT
jgi:hypothetical protein